MDKRTPEKPSEQPGASPSCAAATGSVSASVFVELTVDAQMDVCAAEWEAMEKKARPISPSSADEFRGRAQTFRMCAEMVRDHRRINSQNGGDEQRAGSAATPKHSTNEKL